MLKLIIEDDEKQVKVVRLLRDEVTIGRKEGNTIRLTERNVSRRHARIVQKPEGVFLEDLGSYNGVKVNGEPITAPCQLAEGDKILIGDYTLMLKVDEQESADPFEEMATVPVERVDMNDMAAESAPAAPAAASAPVPAAASASALPVAVSSPAAAAGEAASPSWSEGSQLIPAAEMAQLVLLTTNQAGTFYQLDRTPMVIGRTSDNDIVIDHKSISRNHARITYANGVYSVTDLKSANGVRINGEPYDSMPLRKGDILDLGHVRLRFVAPGEKFDFEADAYGESGRGSSKAVIAGVVLLIVVLGIGFVLFGNRIFGGGSSSSAPEVSAPTADQVLERAGKLRADRQWKDAIAVIDEALAGGKMAPADQDRLNAEKKNLQKNLGYKTAIDEVGAQVAAGQWTAAFRAMEQIPADSVYGSDAQKQRDVIRNAFLQAAVPQAKQMALAKNCQAIDTLVGVARELVLPSDQMYDLLESQKACASGGSVVVNPPPEMAPEMAPEKTPMTPEKTPEKTPEMAAPTGEDADALLAQAQSLQGSDCSKAVKLAQKAYGISHSPKAAVVVGLCGCKSQNATWAKWAYSKLSGSQKNAVKSLCAKSGIQLE